MGSIFSTLSGYFSKTLIIGALIPVAIATVLFSIFVAPFFLPDSRLGMDIQSLEGQWKAILLFVLILTVLIYVLSLPILRLYEGYPWKDSWIGQWRTHLYERKYEYALNRLRGLRTLVPAMTRMREESPKKRDYDSPPASCGSPPASSGSPPVPCDEREPAPAFDSAKLSRMRDRAQQKLNALGRTIHDEYPSAGYGVLPTRLGNAIRAFESYPFRQYKIEAITFYPRLIAKVDKDYAAEMGDAKIYLDFMVNSSLLSMLSALTTMVLGLMYPIPFTSGGLFFRWVLVIIAYALLGRLFYNWSIGQAMAWGGLVKGAFDLYRWDLLKQLGYDDPPESLEKERLLWDHISKQMIYGDSPRRRVPPYKRPAAQASGSPETVELQVTRGVSNIPPGPGCIMVAIRVENVDPKRDAKDVVLTDRLPEGMAYRMDSATLARQPASPPETGPASPSEAGPKKPVVAGANPYGFHVGTLRSGESIVVTYDAITISAGGADAAAKEE